MKNWGMSDLILSDSAASLVKKASSRTGMVDLLSKQDEVSVPQTAMCVKAVVGVLYIELGFDHTLQFIDDHVLIHCASLP